MQVSILYAFIAGIISFLSPCVLPLVPGYVSMLSGIGVEQLRSGQPARNSLFASSLAFVSGFSVVFISFGASASAVGQFLLQHKALMGPVAGAMIVLFGLHLVGWLIKLPVNAGLMIGGVMAFGGAFSGVTSGFLLGFAFAFGWTPCIGPILAAVLVLAANTQTISRGVFLLAVYSAGLAVPFLLTAIGINRFLRFYQRFRRHLHTVEVLSGVLLLFVGGLIFLNRLTWLSGKLGFLNKFAL